jgi:hypothetical protein
MRFKEKFQLIAQLVDNTVICLGYFDTYEDANDYAITVASSKLPDECIISYHISKHYCNLPVWAPQQP